MCLMDVPASVLVWSCAQDRHWRGHVCRHLASFPKHDVTVLLLDDSAELPDVLRNVNPFE